MNFSLKTLLLGASALALSAAAVAKLPAPSDEARAKAAEAAAKTAWSGKVDAYLLCKAQDKTVAYVNKTKPASACVDPGPFVYVPPEAAVPATAPASAAAPAAAAPAKKL
jgi:hypothetical protein